ncbi:MAG TPA: FkbM family methyltransferase, partial [Chitinophagaceae bacterium]
MSRFLTNIFKGVSHRSRKLFHRPFSTFNIGWVREKVLKHQTDKKLKSHLYKNKYKVVFRDGPVFLFSIKELFVDEFYKFRTNKNKPKIIDCGSYIGTSILYFKVNYPEAIITGFEPDDTNYSILKTNIDSWNFFDTNIINAATWINNGNISFNSQGSMASRIVEESATGHTGNKKIVNCVRLKDLLTEEVDFLKIDIEGAEYA